MDSALKLLEQRNYKEITVLDIVAESGVNRNTFYYHFRDMSALVEELARRSLDGIFADSHQPMVDKLKAAVDVLYDNRKVALHVYCSAERSVFDKGLDKVCERLVNYIFDTSAELLIYSSEDKKRLFTVCKACCYGLVCDWFLNGLDENGYHMLHSVCEHSFKNSQMI